MNVFSNKYKVLAVKQYKFLDKIKTHLSKFVFKTKMSILISSYMKETS